MTTIINFKRCVIIALAAFPVIASAQYNKGKELYDKDYFHQAIPYLKKSVDGKHGKAATETLAHSLRVLKNYPESEIYYKKLIELGDPKPASYFYYGEVLMNNGKYDEAEEQFMIYASLAPEDRKGRLMVNAITELRKLQAEAPAFAVDLVNNLNTAGAEFSPVPYKNGIVFAADRPAFVNYVALPSQGLWKTGELNLFFAPYAGDSLNFGESERLPGKLNDAYYNGPVTFSTDGSLAVFSQVTKQPGKTKTTSFPQLYITKSSGNKWMKPQPVFAGKSDYSSTHPAISSDGKTIIFASDRPGGQGGYDLYKTTLNGSSWSEPANLGPTINTPMDEAFPHFTPEGILYFSSDGHPGMGGLDLFTTESLNGEWQQPKNLLAPINSTGDDFGIMFRDGNNDGYFSSNRQGSTGRDDIYHFRVLDKRINIAGKLLVGDNMDDPAEGLTLVLVTQEGTVIQTTTTDQNGAFRFENLPADQQFMVRLDETNPSVSAFTKVYMADKNGNVFKKTTTDNDGQFTFYNLPYTGGSQNGVIADDTRITLSGSLLAGESPAKPLSEQTVYLTDSAGTVVATGKTDQYGNFKFEHLPPDGNFMVSLNPEDTRLAPNTRIVVTDTKGKTVRTFFTDAQGGFKFEVLASQDNSLRMLEEENTSLRIDLKGKLLLDEKTKKPLPNSTVQLVNDRGEVLQTAQTDAQGNFHFVNLPSDQNYMVTIAEADVPVNVKQLFVADDRGKVVKKLLFDQGGFKFDVLPNDHKQLASIYVEDPWLKIKEIKESRKDSITVIENIYYEYGKYEVLPVAAKTLDKVVQIMKENPGIFIELSSHTDSRSSAEFNLDLSRKRARAAVDYIISKGISSSRITGTGMGEGKLVNYCGEGVECTEEQHAQNRRTEFKVVRVK